jgi:hypothetical protein
VFQKFELSAGQQQRMATDIARSSVVTADLGMIEQC